MVGRYEAVDTGEKLFLYGDVHAFLFLPADGKDRHLPSPGCIFRVGSVKPPFQIRGGWKIRLLKIMTLRGLLDVIHSLLHAFPCSDRASPVCLRRSSCLHPCGSLPGTTSLPALPSRLAFQRSDCVIFLRMNHRHRAVFKRVRKLVVASDNTCLARHLPSASFCSLGYPSANCTHHMQHRR